MRKRFRAAICWFVLGCVSLGGFFTVPARAEVRGLPFSRSYSLDDVSYLPRGSRLSFDLFGRVAVIHDGVFAVLNDTVWLNIADPEGSSRTPMTMVVHAGYGQTFYAGRASWGMAEFGPDGRLHARSLVPPGAPAWIRTTTFNDILVTADGVYFISRGGVAFWDFAKKECHLFELARMSEVFALGNRVFISSAGSELRTIDVATRTILQAPETALDRMLVEHATPLDARRTLITLTTGGFFVFDGQTLTPWPAPNIPDLSGRVTVLQRLADGNVAIAVNGKGVFILSPEGALLSALTTSQYHLVSSIASREPGVLWLLTEESVEKILYAGGLTSFGQRLGLTLGWPTVASWQGRIFVASEGVLFEAIHTTPGATARFERYENQPVGGVWTISSNGEHLLMGNASGVFALQPDGTSKQIGRISGLTHVAMVGDRLCYAIGSSEIALFEWNGKEWTEPTPRIPGLAYSFSVHRTSKSVWVEMGGSGVARISRANGALQKMILPNAAWTKALWVNIGIVGDIAVLSTLREHRLFFDEKSERWAPIPEFAQLLDRSPNWIARVWMDETGALWATHTEGLVKFTPKGDEYEMDLSTYDLINDRYPLVQILPGNDIWVSASRSLHHVEPDAKAKVRAASKPVLVSLTDTTRNVELLARQAAPTPARLQIPFSQNALLFQFFSGSYAWRRTPVYEFRLRAQDPWTALGTGSSLRFPSLPEGRYDLEVRIAGDRAAPSEPMTFAFDILPPWHRTLPAYLVYALLGLAAVFGLTRWTGHLAHRRNLALERVVQERTRELESTMTRLNEETRANATLAERDRLAGEIHDSVQQGLSGAMMQLDSTLKQTSLAGELKNRLQVVRNMISYARQEVQYVVWDMDSPLLENNDLGDALRQVIAFTMPSTLDHAIDVSGTPIPLPRSTAHHLLRIAQEASTNAVRHAHARQLSIALDYRADSVSLRITDDGEGFAPEDAMNKLGHFGLRGMGGRAQKIGGALTITSAPGAGTTVLVVVPLNPIV